MWNAGELLAKCAFKELPTAPFVDSLVGCNFWGRKHHLAVLPDGCTRDTWLMEILGWFLFCWVGETWENSSHYIHHFVGASAFSLHHCGACCDPARNIAGNPETHQDAPTNLLLKRQTPCRCYGYHSLEVWACSWTSYSTSMYKGHIWTCNKKLSKPSSFCRTSWQAEAVCIRISWLTSPKQMSDNTLADLLLFHPRGSWNWQKLACSSAYCCRYTSWHRHAIGQPRWEYSFFDSGFS